MGEGFLKTDITIRKVDKSLGLVIGFAEIFSTVEKGEYFDAGGDARSELAAVEAWADFLQKGQLLGDMHETADGGDVVFAFPLTKGIAESMGITCETYGVLVGVRPSAEGLAKFASGEYSGFSIGGTRGECEVVES